MDETSFDTRWWFGNISRENAENILVQCGSNAFLIRTSSIQNCFSLSKIIAKEQAFIHYLIMKIPEGFIIQSSSDTNIYNSISELIQNSKELIDYPPAGQFNILRKIDTRKDEITRKNPDPTTNESNNLSTSSEEEKKERIRLAVINEIVTTEKDYCNDLNILIKYYFEPFEAKSNSKFIPQKEREILFSNVTAILDVSCSMTDAFERRKKHGENYLVGDVFLKTAEEFKIYTAYSVNHPKALKTLEKLRKNNNFVLLEKQIDAMPETKGIGLTGYLIKPIQRITKYPLLLRELIKNTPESHEEYDNLVAAMDKVNQVVSYINENKRLIENLTKLEELQSKIENLPNFDFVKATRSLIYEVKIFTFEKRVEDTALGNMVENEFIDYTIWLFDDMLLWAKLKKDKYKYAGRITMDKLNLNPVQNIPKETQALYSLELKDSSKPKFGFTFYIKDEQSFKIFKQEFEKKKKEFLSEKNQKAEEEEAKKYLNQGGFEFKTSEERIKRSSTKLNKFFGSEVNDDVIQIRSESSLTTAQTPREPVTKVQSSMSGGGKKKLEKFFGNEVDDKDVKKKAKIKAVALYSNQAVNDNDLSFSQGDTIWIIEYKSKTVWKGECNNKIGFFSSEFVDIVDPKEKQMVQEEVARQEKSKEEASRVISPKILPINHAPALKGPIAPPPALIVPVLNPVKVEQNPLSISEPESKSPPAHAYTASPLSNSMPKSSVEVRQKYYPLEVLQNEFRRPKDLNVNTLENYLSDTDFFHAFGMTREAFLKLPTFKRYAMKRSLSLF